jgi:outer membrane protein TolC
MRNKKNEELGMRNKQILLLLMLGALIGGQLSAQEAQAQNNEKVRLSPGEAVEKAIKNNLSLESARVTANTKKRASDLSWNQFIPNVTLGGSFILDNKKSDTTVSGLAPIKWDDVKNSNIPGLNQTDFELPTPAGTMYNWVTPYSQTIDVAQWHIAGSVQLSLTFSIAMIENMNRLKLDYRSGLIAFDKAKLQLERDVRKAYNSMLLLQENIALLRESYEAAGRRVQLAQANYNAGLAPELTLLQARVTMENMKPTMDQMENGYRLAMANFAMSLGMPYDTPFELLPLENAIDFIPLDVKELITKSASGKPDINELRHSILLLKSTRKTQFQSLFPALTLSWNTQSVYTKVDGVDFKDSWQNSGGLTLSLGLRLHSLIPFSPDFQNVKAIDDQITSANIVLAQLIKGTEIEIYNTVLALNKTQISAEAQAQAVALADRTYRLTEQAFRAGLLDLLQVQNAELELKQAKVFMLEQQFNYLNGLLDLEYSIGVPFGTLNSGAQ